MRVALPKVEVEILGWFPRVSSKSEVRIKRARAMGRFLVGSERSRRTFETLSSQPNKTKKSMP